MHPHRFLRLLLATLALAALSLSACGGSLADKSAQGVLKETFGPGKEIKSGKLDLRIAFNGQAVGAAQGPLKVALKGPFSSSGGGKLPMFDLTANLDIGGQAVAAGAVSTGKEAFLTFGGQDFKVPDASFKQASDLYAKDQKESKKKSGPTISSLGVQPLTWVRDPKQAGEEDVGGTKTVHVTSQVDVPAMLLDVNKLLARDAVSGAAAGAGGQVPDKLTDPQRKLIADSVKNASLEVFTGKDDGILRRLNVQLTFDVPEAERKNSGGLTAGTLGLDLVFSELNEKQAIKAPASSRPLSELTGGLAGGATGASGAAGAATPPAAAPGADAQIDPSSPEGKYAACLDKAGQSIAEAQKCAPLLSGG